MHSFYDGDQSDSTLVVTNYESDEDDDDEDDDDDDDRRADKLNRKFFDLIKMRGTSSVNRFLDSHVDFDLNCTDYRGMTGLNVAIEVDCEPIVDLLLSRTGLEIGDSLLYAIRENRCSIAEKLLNVLQSENSKRAQSGCDSVEFPPYLTPLMLAAQCGNFKIVRLLLNRGHTIRTPHKPKCLCKEVCAGRRNRGFETAERTLSAFRALANPAYISLTSRDPFHAAFKLSSTLRKHGDACRHHRPDYDALDTAVRAFAVDLLGLCRTSAEVELVLAGRRRCRGYFGGPFPLARLIAAMDHGQKEFVAHVYAQQTLDKTCAGEWHEWRRRGTAAYACGLTVLRAFLVPWVTCATLLAPHSETGRFHALPVNRALNYAASYAWFLVALAYENNATEAWPDRRGPSQQFCCRLVAKTVVSAYAVSSAVRAVKLLLVLGPGRYVASFWNLYDSVTLGALGGTVLCWWLTYAATVAATTTTTTTAAAADDDDGAQHEPRERRRWHPSFTADPSSVARALLAVATVMSFARLLFLCRLHRALGPALVTLARLAAHLARFAALVAVTAVAFVAGLHRLCEYNGDGPSCPVPGHHPPDRRSSYVGVFTAFRMLLATASTLTAAAAAAGPGRERDDPRDWSDDQSQSAAYSHYLTRTVAALLYTVLVAAFVLVAYNALACTAVAAYHGLAERLHVEWLYGRARVLLYFATGPDMPPPLDFLPSVRCVAGACERAKNCCQSCTLCVANLVAEPSVRYAAIVIEPRAENRFATLVATLVRRYCRSGNTA